MSILGKWHIYEMEQWDEDYFNMETQAFIEIKKDLFGEFQFGLVQGHIEAEKEGKSRLNFSFEGVDECHDCSGRGYIEAIDKNHIKGKFYIHQGERSEFLARRS